MVVPVRRTTIVYAARCEVSQEIVLGVAMLAGSHHFLEIPFSTFVSVQCLLRAAGIFDGTMCKFWMPPCQRVTKVSGNVNITN